MASEQKRLTRFQILLQYNPIVMGGQNLPSLLKATERFDEVVLLARTREERVVYLLREVQAERAHALDEQSTAIAKSLVAVKEARREVTRVGHEGSDVDMVRAGVGWCGAAAQALERARACGREEVVGPDVEVVFVSASEIAGQIKNKIGPANGVTPTQLPPPRGAEAPSQTRISRIHLTASR